MRRTWAALAAGIVSLALTLSSVSAAQASDGDTEISGGASVEPTTASVETSPEQTLAVAQRVRDGEALAGDPSMTLALRDLWMAKPRLEGDALYEAEALLARPTDGVQDPQGFGYTGPSERLCGTNVCIHYSTGVDAPPSAEWVTHNLNVFEATWTAEVDTLGYRAPHADGSRGGDGRLDVYLKDLPDGLYGFCAAERRVKKRSASGYCVLDNDYSSAEFITGTPEQNLAVTAAHEFFHAIQFAYDYAEDKWLMESTATWMEERLADDVNDNRQYLAHSQLYSPRVPLDLFSQNASYQYGNWIFWEYLSTLYGTKIVKDVWKQAGSWKSDGGKYSFTALDKVLRKRGGFAKVYSQFAAANMTPHVIYPEGAEYPAPGVGASVRLSKGKKRVTKRATVHHMSSTSVRFTPDASLTKKWKLRVNVRSKKQARVLLVLHKTNGKIGTKVVRLGKRGAGSKSVQFDSRKIAAVTAVLVNTSTRMRCNKRTYLACAGLPKDDKMRFLVKATISKKKGKR